MITIKSPREIETMRRSGKITANVLGDLMRAAGPGMTTRDLDEIAERGIRSMGGVPTFKGYHGYPASICTRQRFRGRTRYSGRLRSARRRSAFDRYRHDVRRLRERLGGHGGDRQGLAPHAERLMQVTQECLMIGIAQMQQGKHLGDIGHAVQQHAEANGYGVVRELVGHGVGTQDARGTAGTQLRPRRSRHRTAYRLGSGHRADDYRGPLRSGDAQRTAGQSSRQMVNSQRTSSTPSPSRTTGRKF